MIYPIKSTNNRFPITEVSLNNIRFINGPIQKTATVNVQVDAGDTTKVPFAIEQGELKTTPVIGAHEYNGHHYVTSVSRVRLGLPGSFMQDYADHANVGSSETDLKEYELPRELFYLNGDMVKGDYGGIISGDGDLKSFQLYFNDELMFQTKTFTMDSESAWKLYVKLVRNEETRMKMTCSFSCNNLNNPTPFVSCGNYQVTSIDFAAINKLTLRGTGVNDNNIVLTMTDLHFSPKANL